MTVITLLTDFGLRDPFVGVMRGVIAGIAPASAVIDLTHAIAPQAIEQGAFWLARSFRYFPAGTIHVAVVDPGVGTARRALAARAWGHVFVGPDNGLLAPALAGAPGACVRRIDPRWGLAAQSRTFHGRDLFAPVAARLASGSLSFDDVGPEIDDPTPAPWPLPARQGDRVAGRVVVVDHFGNLITDIEPAPPALQPGPRPGGTVSIRGHTLPLLGTYGEAERGALLALVGSFGTVEIAARDGDAARLLGAEAGEPVTLAAG